MPRTFFFSAFIFCLFLPTGKKEQMLQLSKKYFPENYAVLKVYAESSINELARGNSVKEFLNDISTVVHEGYHSFIGTYSSYHVPDVVFRINDSLSFSIRNMKTFPAKEISAIVPDSIQKKIFRYETYVNAKDKLHVTQQFGILGLMEEAAAYYQSYHTDVSLFNYCNDHFDKKDPTPWLEFLGNMASYRYAIAEFELFVSWYIQYAKLKYPSHYKEIMANHGLRKMLQFLHTEDDRLAGIYDQYRKKLLDRFPGRLELGDNYILDKQKLSGTGLYDLERADMHRLLAKPEHRNYRDWIRP